MTALIASGVAAIVVIVAVAVKVVVVTLEGRGALAWLSLWSPGRSCATLVARRDKAGLRVWVWQSTEQD